MSHPDKTDVGLLGLGMMALGMLLFLGPFAVACLYANRVLPLRRSRRTYWIGMAVLVPLTFAAILLTPEAILRLAVMSSYGWDAHADGLRVVNKHGQLSNGRYLSVFWAAAMGGWILPITALLAIPLTAWYIHFSRKTKPEAGVAPSGVVLLDGKPLSRVWVTFYLVDGPKLRGFTQVDTDDSGNYAAFCLAPRTFRVTVTSGTETIPPTYGDPSHTPLEFTADQLGPVTYDIALASSPAVEQLT